RRRQGRGPRLPRGRRLEAAWVRGRQGDARALEPAEGLPEGSRGAAVRGMTLLRAWWALLVLDLGQVALRAPGALTVRGAGWLAALYATAVVAVGLTWWILRRIVRRTG